MTYTGIFMFLSLSPSGARIGREYIDCMEEGPVSLLPDAELIGEMTAGRAEALEEAYRRHAAAVLGLARRVIGDLSLAEEVVQEVFVRLWRRPDRFDASRGTLRSYLLIDTNGRAIESVRSNTARRSREERYVRLDASPLPNVEDEVTGLVIADHLQDALGRLTDGEREAIELAYYGGHTYREVAQIVGAPEGTVKSRIRSGLMRLRDQLLAIDVGGTS